MYCGEAHVKQRLYSIDGFVRESNINRELPTSVAKLCQKYNCDAIYWKIGNEALQYLLSDNAEFQNENMQIGSFTFNLALQNKAGSIIFQIIPLQITPQCRDRIYCELYCIETQTQYKGTYLFDTGEGFRALQMSRQRVSSHRYPKCEWSPYHLTKQQCKNKKRLTFTVYINILYESELCQISLPSIIDYQWDLHKFWDIPCNHKCKVYSPNFGDNCWCLWFKYSKDKKSIIFGLQLLKLPLNHKHGILFRCNVNYQGNDKQIQFIYFVDLINGDVEIGEIPKVNWIKTKIYLNIDENERENKKISISE